MYLASCIPPNQCVMKRSGIARFNFLVSTCSQESLLFISVVNFYSALIGFPENITVHNLIIITEATCRSICWNLTSPDLHCSQGWFTTNRSLIKLGAAIEQDWTMRCLQWIDEVIGHIIILLFFPCITHRDSFGSFHTQLLAVTKQATGRELFRVTLVRPWSPSHRKLPSHGRCTKRHL